MVAFPAPVGGVPFEEDFTPSVIFAVVFAILVFLGVYRLARASTRTLVILAPLIFCTERVVTWSLRAKQAKTPSEELDRNLTIYWQVAFAAAYMTIWTCLVNILRCVLVATTKGSKPISYTAPLVYNNEGTTEPALYDGESYTNDYALPTEEDRPRVRFWYRRVLGVIAFASWITVITGTLLGYNYVNAENDASKGQGVETLRYLTTGIALTLIVQLHLAIIASLIFVRGVDRRTLLILLGLGGILLILPAYELVVARNWTTSLTSTAPGSQNTHSEKMAFYILRAAPEALVCAIILSLDVRNVFGTGIKGDAFNDPKEKDHGVKE